MITQVLIFVFNIFRECNLAMAYCSLLRLLGESTLGALSLLFHLLASSHEAPAAPLVDML